MTILITGTSSGIGAALAKQYLADGHQVIGISRRYVSFENYGQMYQHLTVDLAQYTIVEKKITKLLKHDNSIELAILNAGIVSPIDDLKNTTLKTINQVMQINVWANKNLIDILTNQAKHLKQIVAISSGAAIEAHRGWNAYALSKITLNMLIALYAKENPNVHFSAIAPGIIDTPMQAYISTLNVSSKYNKIKELQQIKQSGLMMQPELAAKQISRFIKQIIYKESGKYYDIRKD